MKAASMGIRRSPTMNMETIRSGAAVVYKARQNRPHRMAPSNDNPTQGHALIRYKSSAPGAEHVRSIIPTLSPYEVRVPKDGRFSMKWIDRAVWPSAERPLADRATRLVPAHGGIDGKVAGCHYAISAAFFNCDLKPANLLHWRDNPTSTTLGWHVL